MITPYQSDWQRRRSEFNHQWLKNRFLSALDTAHNILIGRIHGQDYLEDLVAIELPEWRERREDLRRLLLDFPVHASPLLLFDGEPFSLWDEATRLTICSLVYELWRVRHPVDDLLSVVRDAVAVVDARYERLSRVPLKAPGGDLNPEFSPWFEEFRSACRALSKAIERLPSRVLLT